MDANTLLADPGRDPDRKVRFALGFDFDRFSQLPLALIAARRPTL